MPTLTIKNIPDELYEKLKASAVVNHRSLNGELIYCLESVFKPQKVSSSDRIDKARMLRSKINAMIDPDEISEAIRLGRP